MNRFTYFNLIEDKLSSLAYRIKVRGGLNLLDLHLHSEDFYQHFLNKLYGWELQSLNTARQNEPGVDLVDTQNNIIVQVSATATKQKVESALAKVLSEYKGYSFKFISISKDTKGLRTKTFSNPHNLIFFPEQDILDIGSLLAFIKGLQAERQREIYAFLKTELKSEPDPDKVESNLTTIIKILAQEDWNQSTSSFETVPYDIEEKIKDNKLETTKDLIDDFKVHYSRIAKIYSDFDKHGANKSLSSLNGIRTMYYNIVALDPDISPDRCFFLIIEKVTQKIRESANYTPLPEEELELCVQILVVDTFIRCKIFKNPEGNNDARS